MSAKTEQLQIRVTPKQKAALRRAAQRAGQPVSAYVLSRVLPAGRERLAELVGALGEEGERRYALAAINDLLVGLEPEELAGAIEVRPPAQLSPYLRNYLAAMVEQAATQKGVPPPTWLREIEPLEEPHFATPLRGLRLHLLRASPVPFRRRNIFIDSGAGDRV
jgi:hypothetical protein